MLGVLVYPTVLQLLVKYYLCSNTSYMESTDRCGESIWTAVVLNTTVYEKV